jgi:hypothetical protein
MQYVQSVAIDPGLSLVNRLILLVKPLRRKFPMKLLVCSMCVLLVIGGVFAQSNRGAVTGTVKDPAGAVVPGAKVVVKNVETGGEYTSASTSTGSFTLGEVASGLYSVTVSMTGFKTAVRQGITVSTAQTVRVDFALEVGQISESVTVNADAPLLRTESGELSHNVRGDSLSSIPVLSIGGAAGSTGIRNPYAVVTMLPGTDWRPDASVRVNGTPGNTQALRVEGMDATNNMWQQMGQYTQQGVDAIQEFAVQTSNYAAEYGQAGSAVFNVTMKSGTNAIHGSAYEYFVNESLNASTPYKYVPGDAPRVVGGQFIDGTKDRPRSRRNDFGFTFGGPIYVPKIYDGRDKSFFFFTLEQYRQNTTSNNFGTVPTPAMRTGDFSAVLGTKVLGTDVLGRNVYENTIYDWRTARTVVSPTGVNVTVWDPFPGNKLPAGVLDAAALKIQSYFPLPDSGNSALTNNWTSKGALNSLNYIPSVKIDFALSARSKLSGYWSRNYSKQNSTADGLPDEITGSVPTEFFSHTVRLNYDYTLKPTMLLHLGMGMMHNVNNQFGKTEDIKATFGINTNTFAFPYMFGMGSSFGGMSTALGAVVNARLVNIKPTANPSLSWIKGNHSYKFGAEMIVESHPSYSETFGNNWYVFGAGQTADPSLSATGTTLPAGTAIGFPYASFLSGRTSMGYTNAPSRGHLGAHSVAFYAQDSWKISPKLTLDYGLRYDFQTYLKEQYGRWGNFSPTTMNKKVGRLGTVIFEGPGANHCNCDYADNYKYAFGPRLGLSYQFAPKTVLRGGVGISYGRTPELGYLNYTLSNFKTYSAPGLNQPAAQLAAGPPFTVAWPDYSPAAELPMLPSLSGPSVAVDHNAGRPPRILQWSISIQREISKDLAVEASYVGNRGAYWQSGPLIDVNGLTEANLKSVWGLDVVNSAADRTLLTTPYSALTADQQKRFPLPFAAFPTSSQLVQALRPFPQFTGINYIWSPLGRTWYDALQVTVTKRYAHNLDLRYNFTFQKEMTMGAETSYNLYATVTPQTSDVFRRSMNKYISGLSRPFQNAISISYTIPKVFAGQKFLSSFLKDWQVMSILRYQSAQPIRVPGASSTLPTLLARSNATVFANRVAGQPLFIDQSGKAINPNDHYDPATTFILNPAAWTDPAAGQWSSSTAYYNDYRGRRRPVENVTLARNFRFGKDGRMLLNIRAEFNNVFNRLNIPGPTSGSATATQRKNADGTTSAGFGYINMTDATVASGVRTGQLVARFSF